MVETANYWASGIVILVAGHRLVTARRTSATATLRYMCSFLICFGMGLTVMAPATLTAAAAVEPVPNLTRLVGNALEMAAAASLSLCAYSVIGPLANPDAKASRFR